MSINTKTAEPSALEPDAPAGAPAPKVHLGYLDSLRALAAVDVVIYHAMYQIDPRHPVTTGAAGALRSLFNGHYAVDLFIVLSGFCLMLPIVMIAVNRHQQLALVYVGATATSLALAAVLTPLMGLHGTALSLLVIGVFMNAYVLRRSLALVDDTMPDFVRFILTPPYRNLPRSLRAKAVKA